MNMKESDLKTAQEMANKITKSLSGNGIWGVEFFIGNEGVYFSELSPRPHDTGMVTLAGTQNFNQFELHARSILGIPVSEIPLLKKGASSVILASEETEGFPTISGIEDAAKYPNTDFKIFGKPSTRKYRRMGVALAYGEKKIEDLVKTAKEVASKIRVN